MKRRLLKMMSILLVAVLVSAPVVSLAEEAENATEASEEETKETDEPEEAEKTEEAANEAEATTEEASEETAENAEADGVVSDGEVDASNLTDSNPAVSSVSYVGMNINDISLPDGFIVNYEETFEGRFNDVVIDQYVREDGVTVLVVATLAPVEAQEEAAGIGIDDLLSPFALAPPPADTSGSSVFGLNWDGIPAVYEYNWDNSANCWYWGVYINGVKYTTPEGTYDTNVRNKIQMYSDGSNVYLRIVFAREYGPGQVANSNDYNFYFDGQYAAKFQIAGLTGQSYDPGEYYHFKIAHGDTGLSSTLVPDSEAVYHVTDDGANNEVYLKIPFEGFEAQSGRSLDGVQKISFFSPNLMRNHVTCAGSSTGGMWLVALLFAAVIGTFAVKGKDLRLV